ASEGSPGQGESEPILTATADHLPVPTEGEPAESQAPAPPDEAEAAASPTAAADTAAAPRGAPAPQRPGKSGGQGRSDSSLGRHPRSKPPTVPPPPPTPPEPHAADAQLAQLAYVIVNEAGASVYSTSQIGRDELPDFDATSRSGISIGRRLQ